ncbi:hypothetical protein [Bosea sp. TND4EK4]|uniref:hypothetical protein n=1 Tax=Bosea sp. TND4EK4 TaxID=1907408 RepID=UPI0009540AA9|nr:hypothetical protein [Bosea sp. TND4EK4]SIQ75745.1 hypothetical protein SAMN05880592_105151 [Bosea sp. TND4EK4]
MSEPPGPHTTLEFYPWIVVRFRCTRCRRYGDARLAKLAEKFGSQETMAELIARFHATCPGRPTTKSGRIVHDRDMACGGYCPDLATNPPPDLPPRMRSFTLIKGGAGDMLPGEAAPAERRRRVGGDE